MSTVTKEWLHQAINDYESVRDDLPFGLDDYQGKILASLRIALASLEAEPVSEFYHEARWGWYEISEGDKVPERARIPLYRVAPAPVSLPDELTRDQYKRRFMEDDDFDDTFRGGWNAYRAAMLQGAENVESRCTIQASPALGSSPKNAESRCGKTPVILEGLIAAVNRLLDSDGSRGCYSANRCHDAHEEVERLLAAAPQQEV